MLTLPGMMLVCASASVRESGEKLGVAENSSRKPALHVHHSSKLTSTAVYTLCRDALRDVHAVRMRVLRICRSIRPNSVRIPKVNQFSDVQQHVV